MGSFIGTIALLKDEKVSWDIAVCASPSIGGSVGIGFTGFSGNAVSIGRSGEAFDVGFTSTRVGIIVGELSDSEMMGLFSTIQDAAPKANIPQIQSIRPDRLKIESERSPDFIHHFLGRKIQEQAADTRVWKTKESG